MIYQIIRFFGDLALFLFGVKLMGEGLESLSKKRVRSFGKLMDHHPAWSFFIGFFLTLIVQFSAVVVVLDVGLVNSGIITLVQAGLMILGANLGTPIKTQFFSYIPDFILPVLFLVGAWLYVFSKEKRKRDLAYLFLGFGILSLGLQQVSGTVLALNQMGGLSHIFAMVGNNPLMGVLIGIIFTIIIQSSSGVVAILIALGASGQFTLAMAWPIIIGANIGTTSTAILASLGGRRAGKRTALIHLLDNLFTAMILFPLSSLVVREMTKLLPGNVSMQIALLHLAFNVVLVVVMGPLLKPIIALTDRLLPGEEPMVETMDSDLLDSRMLASSILAEEQVQRATLRMADLVRTNVGQALNAFLNEDLSQREEIQKREENINFLGVQITGFLVKLSAMEMSEEQQNKIALSHNIVADFEKIGNLAHGILLLAQELIEKHVEISPEAQEEVRAMYSYVSEAINVAIDSYSRVDKNLAGTMFDLKRHVDELEAQSRENHIHRLNRKKCSATAGILFRDINTDLERIGTYCQSIASTVLKL